MSRERTDTGQFAETVTLDRVLDVFADVDGPVVTTTDVAEALECSNEAARQKLNKLHDDGRVGKRKTSGQVFYWLVSAAEPNPVNPDDPIFSPSTFASGHSDTSENVDEVLYGKNE